MKNPYHHAEIKPHYLDLDDAKRMCFEAHNILCAGQTLGGRFQFAEDGEVPEHSALWRLHYELAEPRLSQLLLQLAVFVRTFDDVMSTGPSAEAYARHAAETDGVHFVGVLSNSDRFDLREACNKIIHATDFRPVYDRVERETDEGETAHTAWHLGGDIELQGSRGKNCWEAVIYVENFLEILMDRISFEPERTAPQANPSREGTGEKG